MVSGVRVVIVDDGELNRDCLAHRMSSHGVDTVQAWDLPTLLREAAEHAEFSTARLVIVLNVETKDCHSLLRLAQDLDPRPRIITNGLREDREREIVACAEAGVDGMHLRSESFASLLTMVTDDSDDRARCSGTISAILMRWVYSHTQKAAGNASIDTLTARETEILELIAEGLTNREIASRLFVTVNTVKNHVHNMLTKLGAASRAEAVAALHARRI